VPKTRCIALTAGETPARVTGAIRAGASGYILEPFHPAELARAVEEVVSGEAATISPRAAKASLRELRGDPPDQRKGPRLSKREFEVLELLITGRRTPTSRPPPASPRRRPDVREAHYGKLDASTKPDASSFVTRIGSRAKRASSTLLLLTMLAICRTKWG
jgi:two-component system nitrate/nitrite response regulator NarL